MSLLHFFNGYVGIPVDALLRTICLALGFWLTQQAVLIYYSRYLNDWQIFTSYQRKKLLIIAVSNIHLLGISVLGYLIITSGDLHYIAADKVNHYTDLSGWIVSFTAGYFLWDIYIVLTMNKISVPFLCHGLGCFFVYGFGQKPTLHYYGLALLFFEFSTVFLNVRQFLVILYKQHWSLDLLDMLFAISFFFVRICYGSWINLSLAFTLVEEFQRKWLLLMDHEPFSSEFSFGAGDLCYTGTQGILVLGLSALNCVWFYEIIQKGSKKKSKRK